jgi:hypothetical protein
MATVRSPIGERDFDPGEVYRALRPVLSAWLVAILLFGALLTSLTLDHMVTVSVDPPAAYSAARDAIVSEEVEPRSLPAEDPEHGQPAGD